jgi:hypothetical protein
MVHQASGRIFTNNEESALADQMKTEFLDKGFMLTDSDFTLSPSEHISRGTPISFWAHCIGSASTMVSSVILSAETGFLLVALILSISRMSILRLWIASSMIWRFVLRDTDRDLFLNRDEAAWRLFPGGILIWAPMGALIFKFRSMVTKSGHHGPRYDHCVRYGITSFLFWENENSQMRTKPKGYLGVYKSSHPESGWTTESIFKEYLK